MSSRANATLAAAFACLTVGSLGAAPERASGSRGSPPATTTPARSHPQLILVSAPAYGSSYATLTAYDLTSWHPRVAYGPWPARVGYAGFAPAGQKREGDGRTPSGSFGFQFMFGLAPNPGVRFRYRRVHSYDVWDDDLSSPLYNRWVDAQTHDPGASPEPMDQAPAYLYGSVIAYNLRHTPGLGSAIFLHVDVAGPTAGCVSLPAAELVRLMRWLRPARSPIIEMGVGAALRGAAPPPQPVAPSGGVPPDGG